MREAAIVGAACRLPGAGSLEAFWQLLVEGRNSVRPSPRDRWSVERFLRPGNPSPGFAYSFAGGYLDQPNAFDPAPFGISPREAQQMDPQQRLLLEVVWEALEDAAIPPSSLAGGNVGVYVGASMVDYQNGASHDPAVMESHFMTGNSLSILSNRISYVFDFRGPSFTLDSACSSSFVALSEALAALSEGRIDIAVVGGVNLLLSPAPFIGFSQARMLSPTGLSRPFSANGDGYVRSEGAVVLVLRRNEDAVNLGCRSRGVIVDAAVNSDGRTSGISLPSLEGQKRLLDGFYARSGVSPDDLAFVEAHGTGTRVGDPIEAGAIGASLGQKRGSPLPIGSVKSNIGHLEAASGLAGLLKSALALEHRLLPKSLFLDEPNEAIDFAGLNLVPNAEARPLAIDARVRYAGICNYGFGGTNAHVLIRAADPVPVADAEAGGVRTTEVMLLSAADRPALGQLAGAMADAIDAGLDPALAANAIGHGRDLLRQRLALRIAEPAGLSVGLRTFAEGKGEGADFASATAGAQDRPLVFVFSGNGSQFSGMGQAAYASNPRFAAEIDAIDAEFRPLAGWSIAEALATPIAEAELAKTSISQPLLYAIQSALTACLEHAGLKPAAVFGHSVGEVAAAEASGALSRSQAVKLIYLRSKHQESVRGLGRMMVAATDRDEVRGLLHDSGFAGVEIAATNSPTSTTLTGDAEVLRQFSRFCRTRRVATINLDIDYPFHSAALEPFRAAMLADLADIVPGATRVPFVSTVTGDLTDGTELGADYWWRNIRQTVRFDDAVASATTLASDAIFVEIGPRPILVGPVGENLRTLGIEADVVPTFAQKDSGDAVALTKARLIAHGAGFDRAAVFGMPRIGDARPVLPGYPFQRQDFNLPGTAEATNSYGKIALAERRHPLLGARMADGSPEWRSLIDPVIVPYLDDHRVDGGVIVPAAGLIEMALAAGRDLFGEKPLELAEFDILKALAIAQDETREVSTRYADGTGTIEVWSRKRFSAQEWVLHARGTIGTATAPVPAPLAPPIEAEKIADTAAEVYAEAIRAGLEYGPLFRLVTSSERDAVTTDAQLAAPSGGLGAFADIHVIDPASLDAAFHGLFISRPQKEGEKKAHLPVRFRNIRAWKRGATVRRAITLLTDETDRFKTVAITLFDEAGEIVFTVEAAVLKALFLSRATVADRTFRQVPVPVGAGAADLDGVFAALAARHAGETRQVPAPWLLVRAFAVSLAWRMLSAAYPSGSIAPDVLAGNFADARRAEALLHLAAKIAQDFDLIEAGRLAPENPLPEPEALLAALIENFPGAALELRLVAHALEQLPAIANGAAPLNQPPWLRDLVEGEGVLSQPALEALEFAVARLTEGARVPRILVAEPWNASLVARLTPLANTGRIDLALAARDPVVIDRARNQNRFSPDIAFINLAAETNRNAPVRFDAILALAGAPLPAELRFHAASDAALLVAQSGADRTYDFLTATWPGLMAEDADLIPPPARIPTLDATLRAIEDFGGRDITTLQTSDELGALVHARIAGESAGARAPRALVLIAAKGDPTAARLAPEALTRLDFAALDEDATIAGMLGGTEALDLVFVVPTEAPDETATLAEMIEALGRLFRLASDAEGETRITLLTSGADGGVASRLASGIRGFARVAINEYPAIDLRHLDLAANAGEDAFAAALALPGEELELAADTAGIAAQRMRRGIFPPEPLGPEERAVLRFEQPGRLDSSVWIKEPRNAPGEDEIEIEVAVVGLNYRDILVGLGILDDDLLGAGLTAASLGFECSGTVTRVGAGVTHLKPGDRVMGFAKNTFASHLVSPAWHFFPVPEGIDLEAAATIPVAFATAWFSLKKRAQAGAGDDVLIHGGAGGVGLAAIQIAKRAGARVIATASSAERRAIAKAAGADMAFDSRGERFAEQVRASVGGVDIVLNSLAGAAMEASFQLVKPFGRFIEIGKRDYLDNTRLGLRPFVRNIAYFGVDLDELLKHDRRLVEAMMREISDLFARGELKPLPYRVVEGHSVAAAFRSMQASEHVGKIVVRPAKLASCDPAALKFRAGKGVHIVLGGTSGLGFATAKWLATKGAKTIVLASRRGEVEPGHEAELDAMKKLGATIIVEGVDASNKRSVESMVGRIVEAHGPVAGVVHTAAVIDDGMIASLTPERIRAVLDPKLQGALHLEAALEGQPLDYFVVYSSATTVIGSPGQATYVAANAWLEGFARRRRAEGKPALAIGWGAISDVGIIARDPGLGRRLMRTTGVVGISSSESLAHLGRLLALGDAAGPVQFYTNIAPGAAAEKIKLLQSPAFIDLGLARRGEESGEGGDLLTQIEGKSETEARGIIEQALRREVSHILRMQEEQIDISLPLAELGLDSLMALELQLSIERLCGTDVPMVGAGDRRLSDLAGVILAELGGAGSVEGGGDLVTALAAQHNVGALDENRARALVARATLAAE
jgi:phthiocerol/phenolphthiocerol synthesis type-I polyketide synthase C